MGVMEKPSAEFSAFLEIEKERNALLERIAKALEYQNGCCQKTNESPLSEDDCIIRIAEKIENDDRWKTVKDMLYRRFPTTYIECLIDEPESVLRSVDMILAFRIYLETRYDKTFVESIPDQMVVKIMKYILT